MEKILRIEETMDLQIIKKIVGDLLFEIMQSVMPSYIEILDTIEEIETLPIDLIFETSEYTTAEAHKLGYADFLWSYSEKTEKTYIHYGIGYISFKNKFFKLEYSYRSDC